MNHFPTARFLVPFLLLLMVMGCRKVEDDPLEPTAPQQLTTGQVGDSMVVFDNHGYGLSLNGSSGYPSNQFRYVIDSATGTELQLSTTASTNAGQYYYSSSIGSITGVELSTLEVKDSIFKCGDTLMGFIESNAGAPSGCLSTGTFLKVDSVLSPIRYGPGTVVDGSLHWEDSYGTLASRSRYDTGWMSISLRDYPLWSQYSTTGYVAFRWPSGNGWKYGYVELSASTSAIQFKRLVHERP